MTFHAGQVRIIQDARRFNVVACGRRFGKTAMGGILALTGWPGRLQGLASGYDVGWFAPNYKLLDEAWRALKAALESQGVVNRADSQQRRIETRFGGSLDFWTLEEPDGGRGRRYGLVIVDEAAMARHLKDAWEQAIRPTLTDHAGGAWFFSTPNGVNYFHELSRRGQSDEWPDWAFHHAPTKANPHINPAEIDEARTSLPELVFRQEYLAEFVTFGAGLVKPEHLVDGIAPPGLSVVLGVDLAISEKQGADWTAIVAMSRDPETGLIHVREVERHRAGFHEVLNRIKAAAARHNPTLIAIEQTQYQAAVVQELARTTSLPVRGVKPDRDKLTRFARLLTRYEQRLVRHDPAGVPAWFRDELLSFPEGEHDDGVDAAAYAFAALSIATLPSYTHQAAAL